MFTLVVSVTLIDCWHAVGLHVFGRQLTSQVMLVSSVSHGGPTITEDPLSTLLASEVTSVQFIYSSGTEILKDF